jgi:adenylate kinase
MTSAREPDYRDSMTDAIVRTVTELRRSPILGTPGAQPAKGAVAAFEKRAGIALPGAYRAFLALHDGWRGLGSVALFDLSDQLAWRKKLLAIDPSFTGHAIGVDRALGGILCLELSQADANDAPVVCIGESGADIAFDGFTELLASTLLARNMVDAADDAPRKAKKAAPPKKKAKKAAPPKKKATPKSPKKKATPKSPKKKSTPKSPKKKATPKR